MSTSPHGKLQPQIGLSGGRLCRKTSSASNSHSCRRLRQSVRDQTERPVTDFTCAKCRRDCHSRIGFSGHTRRCTRITTQNATPKSTKTDGCLLLYKSLGYIYPFSLAEKKNSCEFFLVSLKKTGYKNIPLSLFRYF